MHARFAVATSLSIVGLLAAAAAQEPAGAKPFGDGAAASRPAVDLKTPGEAKHFNWVHQLTFGGENAEAYFSFDDQLLTFQSTRPPFECDQIFTMRLDGSDVKLVSTGKGKCTCSYFFPSGDRILYCSTHAASPDCPPKPDYSKGYVWRVEPTFDIYTARPDGSDLKPLVVSPGYDAEATISRDGKKIVFTSDRDGDLELYSMDSDGTNTKRLTFSPGYDGGAFFSDDGSKIVYRAHHIEDKKELDEFQALLKEHIVRPVKLELYMMDADGKNTRQITHLDAASFGPFMHPNQTKIIFASNYGDPKGREFDLFLVNVDGSGVERVTQSPEFDGFPMWTHDGKKLVFASNRNGKIHGETNIFLAEWKD
jgi:Tol biopolymer transport system component